MITTSIADAKARLSELLRLVRGGEMVLILHRGRPVARLVPAEAMPDDVRSLVDLERRGLLRRAVEPPEASLLDDAAPSVPEEASLLAAVLAERDSGR